MTHRDFAKAIAKRIRRLGCLTFSANISRFASA
jgi:hypothetical protein